MLKKYAVQKMKIQIEDDKTCDERINPKSYKTFSKNRQMCGSPLKYGQRVLLVIKLISLINFENCFVYSYFIDIFLCKLISMQNEIFS